MRTFKIRKLDSWAGRRLLERLRRRGERLLDPKLAGRVAKIVADVRRGGDRALLRAVRRHDRFRAGSIDDLRLLPDAGEQERPFDAALERMIAAVERYHAPQVHDGYRQEHDGVVLEERRTPLERVGVYVPGGRAAYPSTAVMCVVPARLAGVREIVVATPPAPWREGVALRRALQRLGVDEVWGMGGAHAVAALAYGTETVRRVDKIVGPGNAWVTAAKKQVAGDVAIDGLAGPSEVVIVAAAGAPSESVAADLLAQAEHDPQALALLLTDDRALAKRVAKALERRLRELPTAKVAAAAIRARGGALVVESMERAREVVEELAPEHLQLMGAAAEALADRIERASAVFVGNATPTAFGDYLAGPNHVLPTAGTARFASALGVEDFVRRSHLVRYDADAASRVAAAVATLADVEGLPAHAASARLRLEDDRR